MRRFLISLFLVLVSFQVVNASSFSITNLGVFNTSIFNAGEGFNHAGFGASFITGINATGFGGPAGSVVNLSGTPVLAPADFNGGFLFANGTVYTLGFPPPPGAVALSISLVATAGSVVVPITGDAEVTLTAPLMLTGQLTARNAAFQTVFSIAFNGAGTAAITLHQETPGAWHAHAVAYNFDLSRTPEPATVVLLGSGVAILIGRTLRRKNK